MLRLTPPVILLLLSENLWCVSVFVFQVNQPKFNQRRISSAKFLGELYNYRMVESAVIFRTLYSFTSFGVNPDGSPSSLDPPEHLFRIRLVCTILDTCGQYFDRGSSKRKLDCFLVYFQVCKHNMQFGIIELIHNRNFDKEMYCLYMFIIRLYLL